VQACERENVRVITNARRDTNCFIPTTMFECRIAGKEPDLIEFPLVEDTKPRLESSMRKTPGIGIVG
jgi:hypothetical protein